MINHIWFFLILTGLLFSLFTGNLEETSIIIFSALAETVDISLKLLGPIALWLGLMNIARQAGLIDNLSRVFKPIIKYLFPEIPSSHPAAGSILLNLSANMLGMGNSATPLGIKAMKELQELNTNHNIASASMCTLLALNTSSITLFPMTIISFRAAAGSIQPAVILISTLLATSVSTITAIILDKLFRYFYGVY